MEILHLLNSYKKIHQIILIERSDSLSLFNLNWKTPQHTRDIPKKKHDFAKFKFTIFLEFSKYQWTEYAGTCMCVL